MPSSTLGKLLCTFILFLIKTSKHLSLEITKRIPFLPSLPFILMPINRDVNRLRATIDK